MTTRIILFITILIYSIIVSQSFMYILTLKSTQLGLDASAYIQFRKLIDTGMRANFKYVVYGALLANLMLIISTYRNPGSLLFITASIAFLALITDTVITVKGNLPINDVINTWTVDHYPANWSGVRDQWLKTYQYRQLANITGFISLLAGTVFKS